MTTSDRAGLLLVNLGTPDSPRPSDVRRFLREFLMDPRVLDTPALSRWLLVHLLILPRRPRQSGEAYEKIWTDRGSPLLFHGRDLADKLRPRLGDGVQIELAMRYGRPSIREGLERLRRGGVSRIVVFPLYPQYSSAATGSSQQKVFEEASLLWNVPYLQFVPPFYDHPAFIDAYARVARPYLERERPERVFFSFHGLPEQQVTKSDDDGTHCLRSDDCCERIGDANRNCYRAQCYATARAIAERLELPDEMWTVCFQSRLGRTPWIRPYTDEVLVDEARRGCKRALILSPAFVADCLETIEELGIRGVESWKENGGERLTLVPSVNASEDWADAVVTIARESSPWLSSETRRYRPQRVVAARRAYTGPDAIPSDEVEE
jgi:ferrochelatase